MHTYEIRTDEAVTASTRGRIITDTEAKQIHDWTLSNVKGEALTVAVMDTGIDENLVDSHPWFEGATLTKQYDATGHGTGEDEVGHGTGCASIIANATPKVELYDVRIFGDQGASNGMHSIRRAYKWMINHSNEIDVVNMSWGMRQDVPQVNNLHDKLMENDIYDIVAAGNTGSDGGSPATAPKAFSAGAIDEGGDPTRFSSFDPDQGNPDIAAVGQNVKMARAGGTSMGTPLNSDFVKSSGTSFAAPYVAAAYVNALYKKRRDWDRQFMNSSKDVPGTRKDGAGILKLKETVS